MIGKPLENLRLPARVTGASETATLIPLLLAFDEAGKLLNPKGPTPAWEPINGDQAKLIQSMKAHTAEARQVDGTSAIADFTVPPVNKWLLEKGFTIQLRELQGGPELLVAAAGVLDLTVEWSEPGTIENLTDVDGETTYPAFKVRSEYFHAFEHEHPVLSVPTNSGHRVYFTILNDHPGSGFALLEKAQALSAGLGPIDARVDGHYKKAVIPMVTLKQENDISYVTGMHTMSSRGPALVSEALQQTKLRMNNRGARAQSIAAIQVARGAMREPEPYFLNRPFLTWWEQEGVSVPIFAGFIMPAEWADPGDLDTDF